MPKPTSVSARSTHPLVASLVEQALQVAHELADLRDAADLRTCAGAPLHAESRLVLAMIGRLRDCDRDASDQLTPELRGIKRLIEAVR